jgi:hypothetical protein
MTQGYDAGTASARYLLDISQFEASIKRARQLYADLGAAAAKPPPLPAVQTPTAANNAGALAQQRLATETQRTAAAQNLAARAAQSLATEQNKTAREAANTAAAQDRAAKTALQLAAAQDRAARASQNGGLGPALPRTFAGFTGAGFAQAAGALGLATSIPQVIAFGVESGKASLSLDRQLRLTRELTGTQASFNQVIAAAKTQQQLYGGSLEANIAGIQGLVVTSRSTGAELTTLINLAQRLAVLDPAQGAEGARIALSEVLSGDPRSLARRYEIPLSALEKIKDESVPVADRLKVLDQYLNKIGITSATVNSVVTNQARIYNDLGSAVDAAKIAVGGFLATQGTAGAASATSALTGITQLVGAYSRLSESSGQAGQVIGTIINPISAYNSTVISAGASTLEWLGGLFGVRTETEQAAQGTGAYDAAVQAATASTRANVEALAAENREKLDGQIATATLAEQQARLEADSRLAAQGLLGAGDQAIILAEKYRIATNEAEFLIRQQQQLSNATALADQRVGERDPSNTQTARQFDAFSKLRRQREQEDRQKAEQDAQKARTKAEQDAQRLADSRARLEESQAVTSAQKIALARRRLNQATNEADRNDAQANLNSLLAQQNKVRTGGSSKGISAIDQDTIQKGQTLQEQLSTVNALLERGNLTAHQRNDLLEKRRKLEEDIRGEIEKQRDASLAAQLDSVKDAQARLKEAREAAGLQRALAGGRLSEAQQQAVGLRLSEISLEQQKRARDIAKEVRDAGGAPTSPAVPTPTQAVQIPTTATPIPVAVTTPLPLPNVAQLAPPPVTVNLTLNIDKAGNATVTQADPSVILNLLGSAVNFRNLSGGTP